MSIQELRKHRDHNYGQHHDWCGYCWLESEANHGEFQGGGYDSYGRITGSSMTPTHRPVTVRTATLDHDPRTCTAHQECIQTRRATPRFRRAVDMTEEEVHASHEAAYRDHDIHGGGGGEYAPEPAYDNPFTVTGRIGGFDVSARDLSFVFNEPANRAYRWRWDLMYGVQVHRPIDRIIISGIS